RLRQALPEELYHAAHSRDSSLLLVLALALSPAGKVREQQVSLLDSQLGSSRAHRCASLYQELEQLDPRLRIPLLELSVPALKQRPAEQLEYLFDLLERVTQLAPEQRLFDYVLLRLMDAYLTELPLSPLKSGQRRKLSTRDAIGTLLGTVSAYGHDHPDEAREALAAGLASLRADRRSEGPNTGKRNPTG